MGRRLASITLDNVDDLPARCRNCVYWELDPVAGERAVRAGDPGLEKEAWLSAVLLDWGSCGRVAYVDTVPAGFVLYAPPALVPRSMAFPTSPVSGDAVLLMNAHVVPEFRGQGLGRMLVQTVVKDLLKRGGGIRAVEAFGALPAAGPALRLPGGDGDTQAGCVVPADYLTAVGFKTVRPHPRYPRLRLEVRTAVSWRADVEEALERLLGSMRPEPVRPASARRV
ncbi:MAG: GNAT family N-acetyltransferase [Actinomycetota bacterium]|nr:GNAT family N-acetyltransferase [Actinomycetota bacterium]